MASFSTISTSEIAFPVSIRRFWISRIRSTKVEIDSEVESKETAAKSCLAICTYCGFKALFLVCIWLQIRSGRCRSIHDLIWSCVVKSTPPERIVQAKRLRSSNVVGFGLFSRVSQTIACLAGTADTSGADRTAGIVISSPGRQMFKAFAFIRAISEVVDHLLQLSPLYFFISPHLER